MKLLDKFFMLLFTVILILLSSVMIGLAVDLVSFQHLFEFIRGLEGRVEVGVIGLIFFLMSVRILQLLFRRKKSKSAVVDNAKTGTIMISLEAINSLVRKLVEQEDKVVESNSKIKIKDKGVHIYLKLVVYTETNIPNLTQKLQEIIKEQVTQSTGVKVGQVEILIRELQSEEATRLD
ncbi:alkaline shock response membrane anchor protein AmaP [Natroniella sp. ANB-PHB2]|uniref:alkaline shock response membrane anchor protein AmaP n=1 Tax=Natroniella sp. ANB-PHB2 TaxID=3384444 RepID=UPI0038D37073